MKMEVFFEYSKIIERRCEKCKKQIRIMNDYTEVAKTESQIHLEQSKTFRKWSKVLCKWAKVWRE